MNKKIITLALLCAAGLMNAQAYKGTGDKKFQVAANIQSGATGIHASADYGLGENISLGVTATYLLAADDRFNGKKLEVESPDFVDKFDAKIRFNANLGNVIGLPETMDIYPGLNLGLRNFGTHVGFRYFFTDGFGVFSEAGLPITKYGGTSYGTEKYNNQFAINIGASFNF